MLKIIEKKFDLSSNNPEYKNCMSNTTTTYKELELVKLISEAIDELNQIGCEDIANDLQEKLENLLGLSKH